MLKNSDFKILIVDDERFNIEVVVGFLEPEGYHLAYVTNGMDALKAAFSRPFDLILLDINMPQIDGFEVCRRLKNDPSTKEVPVIFLSALNDIKTITQAFSLGAADYLSKPFNGLELMARVKTQIDLRRYIQELKEKQNRLAQIAATDQLTSLPNKLRFMSVVKKQCAAITSAPSRLVLAYLRMDHMQHINNIYGYKTGDRTLIKVAKVLAEEIRDGEIAARLFGSEFVMLLSNTSLEAGHHRLKKVLALIREIRAGETQVTCSAGIVEYDGKEGYEAFIIRSEKMLEEAKKLGGDRIANKIGL